MLESGTCLHEKCVAGNGKSFISWYGLELSLKPAYVEKLRWASFSCREPAQGNIATGKYDYIKKNMEIPLISQK